MIIQERPIRILDSDPPVRQELDLDFLGTGYRRRVFVISIDGLGSPRPPFQTRSSLLLVPMPVHEDALGRLLYRDASDTVREMLLRGGRYYYIPPAVPCHLVFTSIGVMEALSPVSKSGVWFEEETLSWELFQSPEKINGLPGQGLPRESHFDFEATQE